MSWFFTTHDRPIEIASDKYLPEESITVTATQKVSSLDVNNVELIGIQSWFPGEFIVDNGLSGKDINVLKGVDWRNIPSSVDNHNDAFRQTGIVGEVTLEGELTWRMQVQSKTERLLNQSPIKLTSPLCSHRFCGAGCGLDAANYTVTTTITEVGSQTLFRLVGTTNNYSFGRITFVDGPNNGRSYGISEGSDGVIYLADAPDGKVENGQTVIAFQGCAKTESDCKNRYGNFSRFNGIPTNGGWMPGNETYINPQIIR